MEEVDQDNKELNILGYRYEEQFKGLGIFSLRKRRPKQKGVV